MPFVTFIKNLFKREQTNVDSTLEAPPDVIILNPSILNTDGCSCDNTKCKCGGASKAKKSRKRKKAVV